MRYHCYYTELGLRAINKITCLPSVLYCIWNRLSFNIVYIMYDVYYDLLPIVVGLNCSVRVDNAAFPLQIFFRCNKFKLKFLKQLTVKV